MEVWLKERVLQRYVIENSSKFKPFGMKILSIRDNLDRYPDLYCTLENKKEVPAEVEWKTSNFTQHGHDITVLKDNQGFLLVCEKDQDLGFEIPQIEINISDFEKWFTKNALRIIQDTTDPYKKSVKERKIPKLWFSYLSLKAGGASDFLIAIKAHTWGVQKNYSPSVINLVSSIQKNDLIAFIGPGKGFPGRVDLKKWMKRSFKGYFQKIQVFRITRSYFYDDKKIIWKGIGKWKDEVFPHRFEFDPKPLINLKKLSELSDDFHVLCGVSMDIGKYVTYRRRRNLRSAQMDFVVVSKKGVVLIEVKNWSDYFLKHHKGMSPYAQVERAGLVLWITLKSSWRSPRNPSVTNVLLATRGNMRYNSGYKTVNVTNLETINRFIQNRQERFSAKQVERLVSRMGGKT